MADSRPVARAAELIVEEFDGELVLYDERNDRSYRLNHTATVVWQASDGTRTVADLVARLADELGELADEDLVRVTLDRLLENGLIDGGYTDRDPVDEQVSRRRFMRGASVAGAAALALPVVQAIAAPAAALAASPVQTPPPYSYFLY